MKSVEELGDDIIKNNLEFWDDLSCDPSLRSKFYDIVSHLEYAFKAKPEPIETRGEQMRSVYRRWQRKANKK